MLRLSKMLENKRDPMPTPAPAVAAVEPTTTPETVPTPAAERLAEVRRELQAVTKETEQVETALVDAYDTGDDDRIGALRARRDELWSRRAALTQDEASAVRAVARGDAARAHDALAGEVADLKARYAAHAERLVGPARALAEAWAEYESLWQERRALRERMRVHEGRYGTAPADFSAAAVMDLPTSVLPAMKQLAGAMARVERVRQQIAAVEAGESPYPADSQIEGLPVRLPSKPWRDLARDLPNVRTSMRGGEEERFDKPEPETYGVLRRFRRPAA